MSPMVKNAEVILGEGEHAVFECEKLNALIGDRAPKAVLAIAEAVSGVYNETSESRFLNLEVCHKGKEYKISTASDASGELLAIISYKGSNEEFDLQAFEEYEDMLIEFSANSANVFTNAKVTWFDNVLSNQQIASKNYREWLDVLKEDTDRGDGRPLFLINFFEHFREEERTEIIHELLKLNRQIFISATRDLFENGFPGTKVNVEKVWTVI